MTTERGFFYVQLFPDAAPKHCERIVRLVEEGFYDGIRFHRIEPKFVAQVGDPKSREGVDQPGVGSGGSSYSDLPLEVNRAYKNERGSLAVNGQLTNSSVAVQGGTLLGSVIVDPTHGTLSGDFRYVDLTSTVPLAANTQYYLGAYVNAADGDVFRDRNNGGSGYTAPTVSDPPFSPLIAGSPAVYLGPRFSSTDAFAVPLLDNTAVGKSGYLGPNLRTVDSVTAAVPEPISVCSFGFGLLALGLCRYRSRFSVAG
jgi:hypothetical protein